MLGYCKISLIMGNCQKCPLWRASSTRKKIVLLLVGLDNAGKTSTAKGLVGDFGDTVVPTVGFSSISLLYGKYSVLIYDLGGGPQIRGIWHRYFVDVHGIIFVVDASDVPRLDECRSVLNELLSHPKLCGKPLLVLANKQDREGALDELDIVDKLDLETLVNQQRCPTMVETCSATVEKVAKNKLDPAIHNGYKWLVNCIIREFAVLNSRVMSDVAEQKEQQDHERKERLQRYLKNQQDRAEEGDQPDDVLEDFNPFRPIADVLSDHKKNKVQNGNAISVNAKHEESSARSVSGDENHSQPPDPQLGVTELIKEQLELEKIHPKKKKFFQRSNRTGPAPLANGGSSGMPEKNQSNPSEMDSGRQREGGGQMDIIASPPRLLPPLQITGKREEQPTWNAKSVGKRSSQDGAWDLHKAFEVVPASEETQKEDDDDDDIVKGVT